MLGYDPWQSGFSLTKLATALDTSLVGEGKWQVTGMVIPLLTTTQMVRKYVFRERDTVDQNRLRGGGRGITVFSVSFLSCSM